MLQTVEAVIDLNGNIRLLEPLPVTKLSRVLVTLLEDAKPVSSARSNAASLLEFLCANRLPEAAKPSAEEIEAQIEEARNSWE